ncbi:MAG: GNAT family N-acetyltransferase [Anaerolineae bacterium]|nr:GNAT family N-acetyltransferase [Anaerolineae bacterium]
MKRQITLTPHNPSWSLQFRTEVAALTNVFGNNLLTIHHIGSTAVPGIQAKPIIDMLPIVWDIEQVDSLNNTMAEHGYIHKGEHGIPGRRYFRKGSDQEHTHHIHVYEQGRPEIARHLLFRDYLCAHPDKAAAYDKLKTELSQTYKDDPAAYTSAKSDFILATDQAALAWHQEQERPLRTLITSRLKLIALSLPQLEICLQDPSLLAANLNIPIANDIFNPVVRQATKTKISKMQLAKPDRHHWHTYWLIVRRDDNLGIGTIGCKGQPDPQQYKVEIGYGLSAQHRQNGFMTEAAQTLTRWALAQPDCLGVTANTDPDNIPSHRVLEKIGYARNGELDGEWVWEMKFER